MTKVLETESIIKIKYKGSNNYKEEWKIPESSLSISNYWNRNKEKFNNEILIDESKFPNISGLWMFCELLKYPKYRVNMWHLSKLFISFDYFEVDLEFVKMFLKEQISFYNWDHILQTIEWNDFDFKNYNGRENLECFVKIAKDIVIKTINEETENHRRKKNFYEILKYSWYISLGSEYQENFSDQFKEYNAQKIFDILVSNMGSCKTEQKKQCIMKFFDQIDYCNTNLTTVKKKFKNMDIPIVPSVEKAIEQLEIVNGKQKFWRNNKRLNCHIYQCFKPETIDGYTYSIKGTNPFPNYGREYKLCVDIDKDHIILKLVSQGVSTLVGNMTIGVMDKWGNWDFETVRAETMDHFCICKRNGNRQFMVTFHQLFSIC